MKQGDNFLVEVQNKLGGVRIIVPPNGGSLEFSSAQQLADFLQGLAEAGALAWPGQFGVQMHLIPESGPVGHA